MSAMRRQTLGPISGTTLNTRSSFGRPSLGGGLKPSANKYRQSMDSGAEQQPRRSSTVGRKSSAAGVRGAADPRPLGDKAYMNEALNKLADYLALNGYEHKLDIGKSWKPTGKEFQILACFLFKHLDPKWQCGAKFEDEFIVTLKTLGYPYTISKTALSAVGSPHAWPQVLGTIDWLIDLLNYDAEVEASGGHKNTGGGGGFDQNDNNFRINGDNKFNEYLFEGYRQFLAGNDNEHDDLYDEFTNYIDEQTASTSLFLAEKEKEQNRLKQEINAELQSGSKLPEMRETLKSNENDIEKLSLYVEKLVEHNENLSKKIETKKDEISNEQEKVNLVKEQCKNLKSKINAQELSADEALRMVSEKERIEKQLNDSSLYHQSMKHKEWECQTELNKHLEELEKIIHSYNAKASELNLLPLPNGKENNSQGIDFRIEINKEFVNTATCDSDVLCNDVSGVIITSLLKFKAVLNQSATKLRNSASLLQDKEEQCQEMLDEVNEKLESFQARFAKLEDKYARQKEAHELIIQEKTQEREDIEAKIELLQDDPVERERKKAQVSRRLADLRNALDVQKAKHVMENDRAQRKLIATTSYFTEYQTRVTNDVIELVDHAESKLESVKSFALC